jgi:hypothetical protein
MQSPMTLRSSAPQPQPASPRQGLVAPRGERVPEPSESVRPAAVALEPHWAAAIDCATD